MGLDERIERAVLTIKGKQSAVPVSDDRTETANKPSASVVLTRRE